MLIQFYFCKIIFTKLAHLYFFGLNEIKLTQEKDSS